MGTPHAHIAPAQAGSASQQQADSARHHPRRPAHHPAAVAGLAEIVAGSIATGLGGYVAAKSDVEHCVSERASEEAEGREKAH